MTVLHKAEGKYVSTPLDDELVLMNIETGAFHGLKTTGKAIWELIDGTRDSAAIIAILTDRYDVSLDLAKAQVTEFIARLQREGLVVG